MIYSFRTMIYMYYCYIEYVNLCKYATSVVHQSTEAYNVSKWTWFFCDKKELWYENYSGCSLKKVKLSTYLICICGPPLFVFFICNQIAIFFQENISRKNFTILLKLKAFFKKKSLTHNLKTEMFYEPKYIAINRGSENCTTLKKLHLFFVFFIILFF